MRHNRRAARVDKNQKEIVNALRQIPGVSVEPGHDDLLIGYKGATYWFELKSDNSTNKDGVVLETRKQASQKKLLATWQGHYQVVTTIKEILEALKITC